MILILESWVRCIKQKRTVFVWGSYFWIALDLLDEAELFNLFKTKNWKKNHSPREAGQAQRLSEIAKAL